MAGNGRDYEKTKILGFDTERMGDGMISYNFKLPYNRVSIRGNYSSDEYGQYIYSFAVMATIPVEDKYFRAVLVISELVARSINGKKNTDETFKIIEKISQGALKSERYEIIDDGLKYIFSIAFYNNNNEMKIYFGIGKP